MRESRPTRGEEDEPETDEDEKQERRRPKQRWGYRVVQLGLVGAAGFALRDKNFGAVTSCMGLVLAAEVAHEVLGGMHEETFPVRISIRRSIRCEVTDRSALYVGAGLAAAGDSLGRGLAAFGSSTLSGNAEREGSLAWGMAQAKPFHVKVLSPLIGVSK